jgi:hypothetical protein
MTTEADIIRYVKITEAHQFLAAIGEGVDQLQAIAFASVFDDGADLATLRLRDALTEHLAAAGRAATGHSAPYMPMTVDYDYAAALAEALETIESTAAVIANRARAVRGALDGGLITAPRTWTADDINEGRMLAALEPVDAADEDTAWYAFDALFLEGCVHALNRDRLADAITADTYERHMARIAAVAPVIGPAPAGTAERVGHAIAQWREADDESAHALDAPTPTLRARHAIIGAKTYARLEAFATAIAGPAWDADRRAALKHMCTLSKKAYDMGTDAHGKTRADAAKLFEALHAWRYDTYHECIATARDFADGWHADADGWHTAEEGAYYALYLAADVATNTHQFLDVWNLADKLSTDHRFNIRVGLLLDFEASRTGTGAPLADSGPGLGDATRAMREKVDAYPVSKTSNLKHTVTYRRLKDTIEAIDASAPGADTGLVTVWAHVVKEADAAVITRRQVGELRRLMNAKVAEYGDGHEQKTAAMTARLPEWDRITDELNA